MGCLLGCLPLGCLWAASRGPRREQSECSASRRAGPALADPHVFEFRARTALEHGPAETMPAERTWRPGAVAPASAPSGAPAAAAALAPPKF